MSGLRSGILSISAQFVQLTANLIALLVFSRLLTPQDFGLFAIAWAAQALFLPFLDLGLTPAYIRLQRADASTANAFFTVNALFGLANASGLLIAAPLLAWAYGEAILFSLASALALVALLDALRQQPAAALTRDKRFDRLLGASLFGYTAGIAGGIAAALLGAGVWALMVKALCQTAAQLAALLVLQGHGYRLVGWRKIKRYRASFSFGLEIVISRFLGSTMVSLDKFLFGSFFGVARLGQYERAAQVALLPDSSIRVALTAPALAHLRLCPPDGRIANYRILINAMLIAAGLPSLGLAAAGDWIVPWLLGPQWLDAGRYAQSLGLWGLGMVANGTAALLYVNEGRVRPWILLHLTAIPLVLGVPSLLAVNGGSAETFVLALSLIALGYWCLALVLSVRFLLNSLPLALDAGRTLVTLILATVPAGLLAKQLLAGWHESGLETTAVLGVCALVPVTALAGQWLFNRRQLGDLYRYVRTRI